MDLRAHRPRLHRHRRRPRARPGDRRLPGRRGRPGGAVRPQRGVARGGRAALGDAVGDRGRRQRRPGDARPADRGRPGALGPARRRADQRRRAAHGPGHRASTDEQWTRGLRVGVPRRGAAGPRDRRGARRTAARWRSCSPRACGRRWPTWRSPTGCARAWRWSPRPWPTSSGPRGVRVNGLLPGRVGTERVAELDAADRRRRRGPRGGDQDDPAGPLRRAGGVRPGGGVPALAGRVVRVRRDAARRRRACCARSDPGRALASRSYAARTACLCGPCGALLLALGSTSSRAASRRAGRAPLVVQQVAEAEDRQHAEEPPLQAVEEVRAVVELGQLDAARAAAPARGVLGLQVDEAAVDLAVERRRRSRALEIARVEWSVTAVLSPVASARTQPSTVTSPAGGAGTSAGSAPWLSVAIQPRSTSRAVPSRGDQRDDDVDAGRAVAGAVADDDGVVGVVGAGRGHHAPLVVVGDRAARGEHVVDRRRVARPRWCGSTALLGLAVVEPVELPLAEPPAWRTPSSTDDEREEQPAPRVSRNRNERTRRGYPGAGSGPVAAVGGRA